jgi:hypothetical protein
MSSGSPRTGPSPLLKCGPEKRLGIGQQSWTKGLLKASRLNENCRAGGRTSDTQTSPWTPTSLLTKSGRGPEPAPFPQQRFTLSAAYPQRTHRADSRGCVSVHMGLAAQPFTGARKTHRPFRLTTPAPHSPATSASSAVIPVGRRYRFCSWTGVNTVILRPIAISRDDIVVRNPVGI